MKTISADLYMGLLLAQEEAGGDLIAGSYSRSGERDVAKGEDSCGCIHGAAMFYLGSDVTEARRELYAVGIYVGVFDEFCESRGGHVTVDETLTHFGVDVR
jgi:hypothetical protein